MAAPTQEMLDKHGLITYQEACQLTHMSYGSLTALVNRGRLTPVKVAGSRKKYLKIADLRAYGSLFEDMEGNGPPADENKSGEMGGQQSMMEGVLQLAGNMAQQQLTAAREGYIDMYAAVMAGNSNILSTLLGGQGVSDPKEQRLSFVK
jgi:hypothetical protein